MQPAATRHCADCDSSQSDHDTPEATSSCDDRGEKTHHKRQGLRPNIWHVVLHLCIAFLIGLSFRLVLLPEGLLADETKRNKTDYLIYFGVMKALGDFAGGLLADCCGRKPTSMFGWGIGLFIVPVLAHAEVGAADGADMRAVFNLADALLGAMQGVTWGLNIICLMDLLGPRGRGLASALSNSVGYFGSAVTAPVVGRLVGHAGRRTTCIMALTVAMFLGMFLSAAGENTSRWLSPKRLAGAHGTGAGMARSDVAERSWTAGSLFREAGGVTSTSSLRSAAFAPCSFGAMQVVCSLCGITVNAATALVWGPALVWLKGKGHMVVEDVATIEGFFTGMKVVSMVATGALTYFLRPQPMAALALFALSAGLFLLLAQVHASSESVGSLLVATAITGVGTGAAYPLLAASVTEGLPDKTRASVYGAYRMWRDFGYAIGGVLAHVFADGFFMSAAVLSVWCLVMAVLFTGFLVLCRPGRYLEVSKESSEASACSSGSTTSDAAAE